jgi:hypothetical protein
VDAILATVLFILFILFLLGSILATVAAVLKLMHWADPTWHDFYCVCKRCMDHRLKDRVQREEWKRQTKAQDEAIEELYGKRW